MEIAEDEARTRANLSIIQLICDISDEIIATAEEYEPAPTT